MSNPEEADRIAAAQAKALSRAAQAERVRRAKAAALSVTGGSPSWTPEASEGLVSNLIPRGHCRIDKLCLLAQQEWGRHGFEGNLLGLLASGNPPAFIVGPNGILHPVEACFWNSEPAMEAIESGEILNYQSVKGRARIVFLEADLEGKLLWKWERDADRHLRKESREPVPQTTDETTPKPTSRGRPPNPNIDDFWVEAARMAIRGEQGSPGHTQKKFIDAMMKWVSTNMPPGEKYRQDTVEDKIKKLWRAASLGG